MDINIISQIVVQTAAAWAADVTVYSELRLLVTSDEYYLGTNQRKFKIPNGVDTWADLDYMPIGEVLNYIIMVDNGSPQHIWKWQTDSTGQWYSTDLGLA